MKELKWKWAYFPWLDAPEKQREDAINAGYAKVVLKSEADKVIAYLYAELSHQKYERCIDKANYWVAISYHCVDDKHRQRAERHHRKWLEIAKQFKEAK